MDTSSTFTQVDLSPIIRLPTELHSLIAYHLDLSSRIVLRRLTSKALFPESNHRSLLVPQWRYSMAEARQASEDLRNRYLLPQSKGNQDSKILANHSEAHSKTSNSVFWQSSSTTSVTPKPPPPIHSIPKPSSKEASPEEEAEFFIKSLAYLTGEPLSSTNASRIKQDEVGLKVLSLVGWFGIDASFILNLLLTEPLLRDVQTLVKTERLDSEIWKTHNPNSISNLSLCHSRRRKVVRTQATCKVGSRVDKSQHDSLKGAGLRIGYECWCFVDLSSEEVENEVISPEDASRRRLTGKVQEEALEDGAEEKGEDPLFKLNPNFHIIIQGRYEKQDAMMLEETLDKSFVICNRCKNEILF